MNQVFGRLIFDVCIPVRSKSERLGLLEANYLLNPDRIVAYEVVAVTAKGEKVRVSPLGWQNDLNEFVG